MIPHMTIDTIQMMGQDLICEKFHIKPCELTSITCRAWVEHSTLYHCVRASTKEDVYIIPDMTYPECIFRYHGNLDHPRGSSKLIKRIIHDLIYRGYSPSQIDQCLKPYAIPFTAFYNPQKGDATNET